MYAQDCGCKQRAGGLSGYVDYPNYNAHPDGLGFIPWATVIGGAVDLARSFLGGSDATSCPGQYSGAQLGNLLVSLTPQEMNDLYVLFNKVNANSVQPYFRGVDLDWMAFAIAGGGDCKVTTTNGKALVSMIHALFAKYPGALAAQASFPSGSGPYAPEGGPTSGPIFTSFPGGSTLPVLLPSSPAIPDPGPVLQPATSVPADSSWLDKIKDVLATAAKAGASAAATTAASSTYAALPSAQQAEIERQIRAGQGYGGMPSTMLGLPTPVVLGGAALAAILLLTRQPARAR